MDMKDAVKGADGQIIAGMVQANYKKYLRLIGAQQSKRKPSGWDDIVHLKRFLNEATTKLQYSESNFEKYHNDVWPCPKVA